MEQSAAYVAGALGVEVFMVSADARVFRCVPGAAVRGCFKTFDSFEAPVEDQLEAPPTPLYASI